MPAAQAGGVDDHGQGGQGHRGGGDDRAETDTPQKVEGARGEGDADGVVDQGEQQVLLDVAHGGAGEPDGGDDAGEGAGDEGDVGGLDGDVGAGADGQADVGGGQGGGVVDAVADHAHRAALGLEATDRVGLVLRQHLGQDPAHADLGGDGGGGASAVAGDDDRLCPDDVGAVATPYPHLDLLHPALQRQGLTDPPAGDHMALHRTPGTG
ncbi:hypothetical protein EASAB2608_00066 [Streptomyces sp. EAS-AB2608]|nr:hypothetical protein EASAB2608_00066 [Streptomyces sp. EAS-AB2608]